jgi:hypothetical protein
VDVTLDRLDEPLLEIHGARELVGRLRQGALGPFGLQNLTQIERVAPRAVVEGAREGLGRLAAARHLDEPRDVVGPEASQRYREAGTLPEEHAERTDSRVRGLLRVAVGADDDDRRLPDFAREELQQAERAFVGPVRVIEHEHLGSGLRRLDEEPGERVKEHELRFAREVGSAVEERRDGQKELRRLRSLVSGRVSASDLRPEPELRGCGGLMGARAVHRRASRAGAARELVGCPRLADAGVARDPDDAAVAERRLVESGDQARHARLAADERRIERRIRGDREDLRRLGRDVDDEAEASPAYGDEHLLKLVADGASSLENGAGERRLADRKPGPDGLEQLPAKHDALAFADDDEEQLEHLGLDGHLHAGAAELEAVLVEFVFGPAETHRGQDSPSEPRWTAFARVAPRWHALAPFATTPFFAASYATSP